MKDAGLQDMATTVTCAIMAMRRMHFQPHEKNTNLNPAKYLLQIGRSPHKVLHLVWIY